MLAHKIHTNPSNTPCKGKRRGNKSLQGVNQKAWQNAHTRISKANSFESVWRCYSRLPSKAASAFCRCLVSGVVDFFPADTVLPWNTNIQGRNCCFNSLLDRVGSECCSSPGTGCSELELVEYIMYTLEEIYNGKKKSLEFSFVSVGWFCLFFLMKMS